MRTLRRIMAPVVPFGASFVKIHVSLFADLASGMMKSRMAENNWVNHWKSIIFPCHQKMVADVVT